LTALVAENGVGLRFVTARMSMEEIELKGKSQATDKLWKSGIFLTKRRSCEHIR
jgi:hypothetical protein